MKNNVQLFSFILSTLQIFSDLIIMEVGMTNIYCFSWHLTYITRAFVHVSESCAYIVFRDESRIMTRGVTFVGIVRRDGQEFEILLQIYLTVHRESPSCRHTNLSRLNYKNYWTLKMCWFSIRIMRNNKI